MKYSIIANSDSRRSINEVNDFAYAVQFFITAYQSAAFRNVNLLDNETGEVYAYTHADPFDLWLSSEVAAYVLEDFRG